MTEGSGHPRCGVPDDRLNRRSCNTRLRWWRQKGGSEEPLDHALGRSRGGITTKIHLICDRFGWPIDFTLSAGKESDTRYFMPTLEKVHLPGSRGRPRKRCRYIVADKGYDSDELRRYCDRVRIKPIIAQRKMKRKP